MTGFEIQSEQDTERFASVLAAHIRCGDSIGFSGDLGAGKTTLVRHLVRALGGDSSQVSSPSFTLQHEYQLPLGHTIEHWDLYRIHEAPPELLEPGGALVIRFIEWPERCSEVALLNDVTLRLNVLESGVRIATLDGKRAKLLEAVLEENYRERI